MSGIRNPATERCDRILDMLDNSTQQSFEPDVSGGDWSAAVAAVGRTTDDFAAHLAELGRVMAAAVADIDETIRATIDEEAALVSLQAVCAPDQYPAALEAVDRLARAFPGRRAREHAARQVRQVVAAGCDPLGGDVGQMP